MKCRSERLLPPPPPRIKCLIKLDISRNSSRLGQCRSVKLRGTSDFVFFIADLTLPKPQRRLEPHWSYTHEIVFLIDPPSIFSKM